MFDSNIIKVQSESAATVENGTAKTYNAAKNDEVSDMTTVDIDDEILRRNGHESVLERQFSWLSALGLGFSITNSWVGYLVRKCKTYQASPLRLLEIISTSTISC
jgi:choline transport protein